MGNRLLILLALGQALGQAHAIEWEAVYPASRLNDLNEVIHAKGKYWAVGDSGTVISSKDGSMWQRCGECGWQFCCPDADWCDCAGNFPDSCASGVCPQNGGGACQ